MRILFVAILSCAFLASSAQGLSLNLSGVLPNLLKETSGLAITPASKLWSHNDSGNAPELYEISSGGSLLRTLYIDNAQNTDWEDLTTDDQGRIYIGDFGNNNNNRQDLKIYRIPNPDQLTTDTVSPAVISFSFEDQKAFPPPASEANFDCEAFFWHDDSLFLFTKNRSNPFNGYCRMYRMPADTGTHVATLVDSFFTGLGLKEFYWISAADISADGKRMVLLGYDKLWLFHCYEGNDFLGGGVREMPLGRFTQKEAIAFLGEKELFITDEEYPLIGGKNLYKTDLGIWADSLRLSLGDTLRATGASLDLDAGYAGGSYLWSNGDTTRITQLTTEGSYALQMKLNGCIARDSVYVMFPTGLENEVKKDAFQLSVSPNPFQDYTDIICVLPKPGTVRIQLYDSTGRKVAAFTYPQEAAGTQKYRLSRHILSLSPGQYLLVVTHNDQKVEKKIIKN